MCKAILISEVIINECIDAGYPLNTSKLQKILFYMQKEYLNQYNEALFDEEIVAWECGPAIKEINDYFVDGKLGFSCKVEQGIILTERHKQILDDVLHIYGKLSSSETAEISRKEPSWISIWDSGNGKNKVIPLDLITQSPQHNSIGLEGGYIE